MVRADEGGQVDLSTILCFLLLTYTTHVSALADFSGYLTRLLQNHTVSACDGEHLTLHCPRHSTISVQSAFYGHHLNGSPKCASLSLETMPNPHKPCLAPTALQKVLDECQNLRSCQLPVNSRVFGLDPCPGTTKYLLVSYKCKPTEYKSTSVCENRELKLHCKEPKLLNIYSAVYGHFAHEKNSCSTDKDQGMPYDCLSYSAMQVLAHRCYGKQRCRMLVSDKHFGSPCLPGVIKYLTVNYSCDITRHPSESQLPNRDGLLLSNILAAYSYIRDHPETAALLFVSSVCVGLIITLFALVIHISWRKDWRSPRKMNGQVVQDQYSEESEEYSSEEQEEDESSNKSRFSEEFRELCKVPRPLYSSSDAADLAERIERREQIIQEIWMNSGLDLPPNRLTIPFL
ncbi:protein eva-1 homolog C isoform X3 [Rana temporaria]|uniref:protein eva-1 homolog C isoform X3 n=1 Tax=Rana temporaria TaxID=8407 RepID=UPI001AAC6E24|nr:protein eva-1 homolog C isoform X3 [Rana temporaria]